MKNISHTTYTIIIFFLLFAISAVSYVIGYQKGSMPSRQPSVLIDYESIPKEFVVSTEDLKTLPSQKEKGIFFGSKSGTKYYGSTSCANAKRIKPENYIWFSSQEDAEIQGYTRGTC